MFVELIVPLSALAHGSGGTDADDFLLFGLAFGVAIGLFLLGRRAEARKSRDEGDTERRNDA